MKTISRPLKSYEWEFNPFIKEMKITKYISCDGVQRETVTLDITRMYSLMRFMIRIAQKMPTVIRTEIRERKNKKK